MIESGKTAASCFLQPPDQFDDIYKGLACACSLQVSRALIALFGAFPNLWSGEHDRGIGAP